MTKPIHVLVSARVTAEQLERMRDVHPRLVIDGEPGGISIMGSHQLADKDPEYPEVRPDLDVAGMLRKAEVIIASDIPPDLVSHAPGVRWVQFVSAGIDEEWQPCLDSSGIVVTCAKGMDAIPMAEYVLSGMLMFAKSWPRLLRQQRERCQDEFLLEELYGKTVVLLGVGAIGSRVAHVAHLLGMQVLGVRRRAGDDDLSRNFDEVVTFEQLDTVIDRGDFVVATLPHTARTYHLLDETMFRAMKSSAVFINVGRGQAVHEAALIRALQDGWIGGAVLDVVEHEPLAPDSPLWDMPNVLLSPHMGAETSLTADRLTDIVCNNLGRYAEGEPLSGVVDPVEHY